MINLIPFTKENAAIIRFKKSPKDKCIFALFFLFLFANISLISAEDYIINITEGIGTSDGSPYYYEYNYVNTTNITQVQNNTNYSDTYYSVRITNPISLSSFYKNKTEENKLLEAPAPTPSPSESPAPSPSPSPAEIIAPPNYVIIWVFFGIILIGGIVGFVIWKKAKNDRYQRADYEYFRT